MVSWLGFVSVPQGSVAILERSGKYVNTLQPGLHWFNPLTQSIKNLSYWKGLGTHSDRFIDMTEQTWVGDKVECYTKDQMKVNVQFQFRFKIAENNGVSEAKRAVYAVSLFPDSLINMCSNSLRTKISLNPLNNLFTDREKIGQAVMQEVAAKVDRWGVRLLGVDVDSFDFDQKLTEAIEKKHAAEALLAATEAEVKAKTVEAEGKARLAMIPVQSEAEQKKIINESEIAYVNGLAKCLGASRAAEVVKAEKIANAYSAIAESPKTTTMMMPSDFKGMLKIVGDKA